MKLFALRNREGGRPRGDEADADFPRDAEGLFLHGLLREYARSGGGADHGFVKGVMARIYAPERANIFASAFSTFWRPALGLAAALALALGLAWALPSLRLLPAPADEKIVAEALVNSSGGALLRGGEASALQNGLCLLDGDRLRAPRAEAAYVDLNDNVRVRLGQGGELCVSALDRVRLQTRPDVRVHELELFAGAARVDAESIDPHTSVTLACAGLTLSANKASFSVLARPGLVSIEVHRGMVKAVLPGSGATALLGVGEGAVFCSDGRVAFKLESPDSGIEAGLSALRDSAPADDSVYRELRLRLDRSRKADFCLRDRRRSLGRPASRSEG